MSHFRGPIAALAIASALWGGALTGTEFALDGFDPLSLIFIELLAATLMLWVVILVRGFRLPGSWKLAVILGLLEPGAAYLAETFGLSRTSAAHGAIICGLESAFVVVLAALVLKERITRATAAAVVLAFVGLLVLQGGNPLRGGGFGDLCVALGVLSASCYTIVLKRFDKDSQADPLALTTIQFTAATTFALSVVASRWASGSSPAVSAVAPKFWLVAIGVGVFGFGVSFLIFNATISRVEAGAASVVLNLIPVFGVLSAMVILGETLSASATVGALLVAASVVGFVRLEGQEAAAPEPTRIVDLVRQREPENGAIPYGVGSHRRPDSSAEELRVLGADGFANAKKIAPVPRNQVVR